MFAELQANPPQANASPARGHRLRVVVLPFLANPNDSEQGIARLVSRKIATALSRCCWFDVVESRQAPHRSTDALNDHYDQPRPALDYIIDGALSRAGTRYYVSLRALDSRTYVQPILMQRFEFEFGHLPAIADIVPDHVIANLRAAILANESEPTRRTRHQPAGLVLQAIPLLYSMERHKFLEAGRLLDQALVTDSANATALAWAALWRVFYVGQGWADDIKQMKYEAQEIGHCAFAIEPDNPEVLAIHGHINAFIRRDFENAIRTFDRLNRLNPEFAFGWAMSALTLCYVGKPEDALRRLDIYRRLATFESHTYLIESKYAVAHAFAGNYQCAAAAGRRAVEARPGFTNGYKPLIAALGHLGRREEARGHLDRLLAMEPGFNISQFARSYPFKRTNDRERYVAGLRLAGAPER